MARRKSPPAQDLPTLPSQATPKTGESVSELLGRLGQAFPGVPEALGGPAATHKMSDSELIATARVYALRVFLARAGFDTMAQACKSLGLSDQQVWDRALIEAGLPVAPLPDRLQLPV